MAKRFGDYEILGRLGQGAFGVVYKARHVPSGRVVALKALSGADRLSDDAQARFEQEARVTARLRHRNIVTVHDVGRRGATPFIAMDFVRGRTLQAVIDEGAPDERLAATWMVSICRAMRYAHSQRLVHRDIKPANVMIDHEGEPIVMDFGIAKDLTSELRLTQTGGHVGTPKYMSPEQFGGDTLDERSDVYSLGALLYALLTGGPPFAGADYRFMAGIVKKREPDAPRTLNPDVSADLETVCLKAMRKAPEDRYPTAEAMAEDLVAFLESREIQAKPESSVTRAFRAIRRKPVVAAWVVGIPAAAAVFGVLLWRSPEEDRHGLPIDSPGPRTSAPTPMPKPSAAALALQEVDGLVKAKQYDRALARLREEAPKTSDAQVKAEMERYVKLIESLKQAAATGRKAPETRDAYGAELAAADALFAKGQYQAALAAYEKMVQGQFTDKQKQEAQQRINMAKRLIQRKEEERARDRAAAPGRTESDGDKMLAKCGFDEAASAYKASGSGQLRKDLAARLIALRNKAAAALSTGSRVPVTLGSGARARQATASRISPNSVVLAATTGVVAAHQWSSLDKADVVRIYRACLRSPTADDRFNLGLLCLALGLRDEAQKEFRAAESKDPRKKAEAERFLKLNLAR